MLWNKLTLCLLLICFSVNPSNWILAQNTPSAMVGELTIEDKLRRPVNAKYLKSTLKEILQDLSEKNELDIQYDEKALRYAKIDPGTEVSLRFRNVPLGRVIELTLQRVATADRPLSYELKEDRIIAPSLRAVMKRKKSLKLDLGGISATLANQKKEAIHDSNLPDDEKELAISEIDEKAIAETLYKQIIALMDPNGLYKENNALSLRLSRQQISAFGTDQATLKLEQIYTAIQWLTDIGYMKVQPQLETFFSDDATNRLNQTDDMTHDQPDYLTKAIRTIARESGANVFIDWTQIHTASLKNDVKTLRDVSLLDAPLHKHLMFTLSSIEGGKEALDYMIDRHGVVVISTQKHLDRQWMLHVYDIRPLIESSVVDYGDIDEKQRKIKDLQDIISVIIEDNLINEDQPQAKGSMMHFGNHLLVNTSLDNHRQIHRIFETMLKMKEAKVGDLIQPKKAYKETMGMMKEKIMFEAENQSWRDTMKSFKDQSNIYNIYINWAAIDRAKIATDKKMTIKVRDQSFVQVLNALLAFGSEPEKAQLDYFVDQDGILIISTIDDLSRRKLIRLYDLREMVINQEDLESGKKLSGPMIDTIVNRLKTDLNAPSDPKDRLDLRLGQSHGLLVVHGLFNKQRKIKSLIDEIKAQESTEDKAQKPE